jgi:hypothetical protein
VNWSVLVGDIVALHDKFSIVTPASPVPTAMVVNDTSIRQDL